MPSPAGGALSPVERGGVGQMRPIMCLSKLAPQVRAADSQKSSCGEGVGGGVVYAEPASEATSP